MRGAHGRLTLARGTMPPYDQFITLGPVKVKETVDAVKSRRGPPYPHAGIRSTGVGLFFYLRYMRVFHRR